MILLHIIDIVMCPELSIDTCVYLKSLIIEHHAEFIKAYSEEKVTPKLHFLLHYSEQVDWSFDSLLEHEK